MKIQEIARLAGVSTATVSRVFSHHPNIRREVREQVFAVARAHNYRPRLSGRQKNVVIVSPYEQIYPAPEYVEMVTTPLIRELARNKFRIEILPADDLERLSGIPFCGVISIGIPAPDYWEERFAMPYIVLDQRVEKRSCDIFSVRSDEEQGMDLAISHLVSCGCRKVGVLIHGSPGVGNAEIRRSGALKALRRCGMPCEESLVRVATADLFMEETGKLLRRNIDGIFCCGGSNVGGIAAYCLELFNKKIPTDIKLVSSERTHISRYCIPAQTTISQDYKAIAEKTVELLENLLSGTQKAQEIILPYHLIKRESA